MSTRTFFLGVVAAWTLLLSATVGQSMGPVENLILSLPGLEGSLTEEHYGGYITLNGTEKKLFYYLATSRNDPATDPIVLWLNGGPGSTSLIGWGEENGPFTLTLEFANPENPGLMPSGVSLAPNPYSWNENANMLYIDSPAGTGLSWSADPDDYNTGDLQTQADLQQAVRQWFQMYPAFQTHEFYITGESYAGTYVPMLAVAIVDGNEEGLTPYINLQGIMIGNAVTYDLLDNVDLFQIYTYLSLIPLSLSAQLASGNCDIGANNGESISYPSNPLNADYVTFSSNVNTCDNLFDQFTTLTENLYGYDLLSDNFYGEATFEVNLYNEIKSNLTAQGINYDEPYYGTADNIASSDDRATTYFFNQRDVRAAVHADQVEDGAGFFTFGQPRVNYTYDFFNTIPLHQQLIAEGIRVLVYSGDHDGVSGVPWPGSQTWTTLLGQQLGELSPWQPWYKPDQANFGSQTAGYITQYKGLTYMTVRGAGHQVPTYKPEEAFIMFNSFLMDALNSTTQDIVAPLNIPLPI